MTAQSAVRRCGATLIELIASLLAAAALMAGLSSSVFIALRASNPSYTPAASVLEGSACLADMSADLQFATAVTLTNTRSITVTVPDRTDADALAETITYSWSGTAGAPVTRQYNGGTVANVLPSAHGLSFTLLPSSSAPKSITVEIQPTASSATAVQAGIPLVNMP